MSPSEKWNYDKINHPQFNVKFKPMVDALQRRKNKGNCTTHKDWFINKCHELELDFEQTHQHLRQRKIISKMRSKVAWPVCIHLNRIRNIN